MASRIHHPLLCWDVHICAKICKKLSKFNWPSKLNCFHWILYLFFSIFQTFFFNTNNLKISGASMDRNIYLEIMKYARLFRYNNTTNKERGMPIIKNRLKIILMLKANEHIINKVGKNIDRGFILRFRYKICIFSHSCRLITRCTYFIG